MDIRPLIERLGATTRTGHVGLTHGSVVGGLCERTRVNALILVVWFGGGRLL
jgi:hypothetical protein